VGKDKATLKFVQNPENKKDDLSRFWLSGLDRLVLLLPTILNHLNFPFFALSMRVEGYSRNLFFLF
jgi:hypothetical protein